METQKKKLYRSNTDRIIAGVCGGLATYFSVDPILMRGIFIILALNGAGVLLYLVLMVIIPREPGFETAGGRDFGEQMKTGAQQMFPGFKDESRSFGGRKDVFALLIIAFGLLLLVNQIFPFSWFRWNIFWPVAVIFVGVWIIMKDRR